MDQQPSRVAARPRALGQGFFRRLHARLDADQILDPLVDQLVQFHEEIHRGTAGQIDLGHERFHQRAGGSRFQTRRKLVQRDPFRSGRGSSRNPSSRKKSKGLTTTRSTVRLDRRPGIPSPFPETPAGRGSSRTGLVASSGSGRWGPPSGSSRGWGATMRRRSQPDHLGSEGNGAVVAVGSDVVQLDLDGHGDNPYAKRSPIRFVPSKSTRFVGLSPNDLQSA
jgi:hypothetical protein